MPIKTPSFTLIAITAAAAAIHWPAATAATGAENAQNEMLFDVS